MRQFFSDLFWEKKAAVFLLALAILVMIGPFGTYADLALPQRFVYWTILMIGIGVFMHVSMAVAITSPYLGKMPKFLRLVIGSYVAAIPGVAILVFVNDVYRPDALGQFNLLVKWAQVGVIGVIIGMAEYMDWRTPEAAQVQKVITPLHKRLPPALGHDIISMSMQDHYVEVTTTLGREVILMRFADALAEIGAVPGQRIHRSHWVAQAHMSDIIKEGQRSMVCTSDGRKLPVSATYADDARKTLRESTA